MSSVSDRLLGDAEAVLRREAEKLRAGSPLDKLLAGWLLPRTYGAEANAVAFAALSQWRETRQGGAPRTYQSVGALALATSLNLDDSERRSAFFEGLDWVLGTSVEVDGAPVGLAADPAAVLAVVVTLVRTGDHAHKQAARTWLTSVINKFGARLGIWERAQLNVASQLLGEPIGGMNTRFSSGLDWWFSLHKIQTTTQVPSTM